MSRRATVRLATFAALAVMLAGAASVAVRPRDPAPIRVGAVFPLAGNAETLAGQQLQGVRLAVEMVNADGGIGGRPVELDVRDYRRASDAPALMADLGAQGISAVIGAYASDLSVAASAAADAEGLVYWEAGAVADRLTARGLSRVFRVGASGENLGVGSATFAATELAPRLGKRADELRIAVVNADDDYARSVADAVVETAERTGMPIVSRTSYSLAIPDWHGVLATLADSQADVIVLASHIPDGIAFRRAMLDAGLETGALIGTTMAQCDPDFAGELGPAAIGVFASDRPTGGFQPSVLDADARALYDRFATAWQDAEEDEHSADGDDEHDAYAEEYGHGSANLPASEHRISGPLESGSAEAGPSEEGLSGFTAGWVLFHHVLPAALAAGALDADGIAAAARALDLPSGALPNGAGLRFSTDPATVGQNERAAAVIWQWQAIRSYTFVWPPAYATGAVRFVPLP